MVRKNDAILGFVVIRMRQDLLKKVKRLLKYFNYD